MGADLYITTKRKADFSGLDAESLEFMLVHTQKVGRHYVYYWRDSYNTANLAWCVGLDYDRAFENNPIGFLKRLAKSTDREIAQGYKQLCRKFGFKAERRILEFLKEKRNYLKRIVKAGIISVEYSI